MPNKRPIRITDIPIVPKSEMRRVVTASALGNAVEWFDFGVYGFLAVTLGNIFFPNASPSIQLIASLATFSVPFLFRPLGGLIFGYLGDKYGRKSILSFTIIMMSISTFAIGLIPSYATIGIAAPLLLLAAKIIQGISVGGEYAGAVVFVGEYAPDKKRGLMASWLDFGSIAGFLVGATFVSLLTSFLGQHAIDEWAWRLPFMLALPLGAIGLYLRKSLDESPTYEAQSKNRDNQTSVTKIIKDNLRGIILCCLLVITTNTAYYMLLTYLPNYLTVNLHYKYEHGVLMVMLMMVFMLILQPLYGHFSDRFGRKPFLLAGSLSMALLSIPSYWMIINGNIFLICVGVAIQALTLGCFIGIMASILPALFPTDVRFRTLGICFNVSVIVAGITPPLTAYLVDMSGSLYMPAYYLMVMSALGLIMVFFMHETAKSPLKNSKPVASSISEAQELLEKYLVNIEDRVGKIESKINSLEDERQDLVDQHPKLL